MKKRSFLRRKPQKEEMNLQITSLADVFTIILVFMLKSYAVGAAGIEPGAGVTLPSAKGKLEAAQAIQLQVSATGVTLAGKPLMRLAGYRFETRDLDPSTGASRSLQAALGAEKQAQHLPEKAKITVMADQSAPYSTIKTVLASAATQGFSDLQLAVVTEE